MSNIISRTNASRQGSNSAVDTKGGKFVKTMQKLAKLRSKSRSKSPLQVGNVLTKKALPTGKAKFESGINKPEGKQFAPVNVSEGQAALNPKQQGAKGK